MNGTDIKSLRTRLGLTQKALAEMIGVRSNTIARWERNELGVSPAMADRLRNAAESLPSGNAITRTSSVILDPHHKAILEGLNGHLDPLVFEECAVNLLQANWPGLVAIPGGQDDGFDGAVADGRPTEPFPLIVTTGARFVENLKKNLDSAKRAGRKPKKAMFATSRRIRPTIRRRLYEAAQERNVTLLQTYDQDWFAMRLYREPQWCKRLLGISGRPHALSAFPISRRPALGDAVLGREQEMQWLQNTRDDCLLVGEPGSGKTFLLSALVLEGKALFLVDENREQIANDLRSLRPNAVIVDDAHVRPSSLANLIQLRDELHADFQIIATCWPADTDAIGIHRKLKLCRIDADTMIQIIKSIGIHGPNELLYFIRHQASGRPGLAATLAHLCILGHIAEATSGEGLIDSIARDLDQVLGSDSLRLLAPFALGGDAGARKEDVAERLGMSLLDASNALAKLGAAGVLRERAHSCISVEPPPMRWVLVRRMFFGGPASLPVDRFLPIVQDRADSLETLIGARARGADVPDLERLLEEAKSQRLWAAYASMGPDACRFVLMRHPEMIGGLAEASLANLPEEAIPMLLSRMETDCKGSQVSESALRPLEKWIKARNYQDLSEALRRRQTLVKCAEVWWRESRNSAISIAAMCTALSPEFDFVLQDPGAGTRITITRVTLQESFIDPLATSWAIVVRVVTGGTDIPWISLLELIETWRCAQLPDDAETQEVARKFLTRMLSDLSSASQQYPGVQHRIAAIAQSADLEVDTKLTADFECLHPQNLYDAEDFEKAHQSFAESAQQLARRWKGCTANKIAGRLGYLEHEAHRAGITYLHFAQEFSRALAAQHRDPVSALETFMRERLSANLLEPFLRKAFETECSAWHFVSDCINHPRYTALGVELALCNEDAPPDILSAALEKARDIPRLIDRCCTAGTISKKALFELYRSPDASMAISAALGFWQSLQNERREIELDVAWRRAFLRSAEERFSDIDGYWIEKILEKEGELVPEWLIRMLNSDQSYIGYQAQKTAKKIIASLDTAQRLSVLSSIRPRRQTVGILEIICALVGNDANVYRHLLKLGELKCYHLAPLQSKPSDDWRKVAILALDFGYSCNDIVGANLNTGPSWVRNESDMWADQRHQYEKLQEDEDSRIANVGKLGAQAVGSLEQQARQRERDEAVYGLS